MGIKAINIEEETAITAAVKRLAVVPGSVVVAEMLV